MTLRELAKDYAGGSIDKENYRKLRAELIAEIIEGKIPIKPMDSPPAAPLPPPEEEQENRVITKTDQLYRDKTGIKPKRAKKSSTAQQKNMTAPPFATDDKKGKSPLLFVSVSAFIVIPLIVLIILFYPKPPTQTSTTPAKPVADITISNTDNTAVMAGENLITDFLKQKNWREESLDKFIGSWLQLTKEEKNSVMQTKKMQRMNNSIYKQFLEEKALASIDKEQAIIKQEKLIQFAQTIGLNDPRLIID